MGDNLKLKLSSTGQIVQDVDDKHEAMKAQLQNKKILCRICKGDHFTTKCPYKDSLGMEDAGAASSPAPEETGKDSGTQGGMWHKTKRKCWLNLLYLLFS